MKKLTIKTNVSNEKPKGGKFALSTKQIKPGGAGTSKGQNASDLKLDKGKGSSKK